MPKKPATTREAIIEGAFQLIREAGDQAFSARSLAAFLGCSTQPIMYQFPNLEELKELAYNKADAFHSAYILSGADLSDIGVRYVRFAAEEPFLFRFLFQSGRYAGLRMEELIRSPEAEELLRIVGEEAGITQEEAAECFGPLYAAVHGFASLIANNGMEFDPEYIQKALTVIADRIMGEEKS